MANTSDYILRGNALDAIRKRIRQIGDETPLVLSIGQAVVDVPAADVRPVIRCCDCKKFGTVFCALDVNRSDVIIKRATENDYCSKAEQK